MGKESNVRKLTQKHQIPGTALLHTPERLFKDCFYFFLPAALALLLAFGFAFGDCTTSGSPSDSHLRGVGFLFLAFPFTPFRTVLGRMTESGHREWQTRLFKGKTIKLRRKLLDLVGFHRCTTNPRRTLIYKETMFRQHRLFIHIYILKKDGSSKSIKLSTTRLLDFEEFSAELSRKPQRDDTTL